MTLQNITERTDIIASGHTDGATAVACIIKQIPTFVTVDPHYSKREGTLPIRRKAENQKRIAQFPNAL